MHRSSTVASGVDVEGRDCLSRPETESIRCELGGLGWAPNEKNASAQDKPQEATLRMTLAARSGTGSERQRGSHRLAGSANPNRLRLCG